jgi:hypothetical protein
MPLLGEPKDRKVFAPDPFRTQAGELRIVDS